jgi:choline dehydrogenase-like flavoprotein
MARTEWLSEGVEKLAFELLDKAGSDEPHCDIAVVGSGYGGAVAAARLAGAAKPDGEGPLSVWLLERGREFVPGEFPERFADLPGEVRVNWRRRSQGVREGLFDLRIGEDVSALLGNGLGGGSLINAGVLARPDPGVLRRSPWPAQLADGALDPFFAKAEDMLGAARLPGRAPAKLAALQELAANLEGGRGERATIAVTFEKGKSRAGVAQEPCLQCGDCFTGCNHWAKNTLAMNYLPLARRRGARLFTGVTVLSLKPAGDAWELALDFTAQQTRKRFGEKLPPLRARRVILAAGAYGSTAILLRSHKLGFEQLSHGQLGRRFSTNGDMIAASYRMPGPIRASAPEGSAPHGRGIGPTISGLIDLRRRDPPLVVEELAIPAALRRAFEEVVTTFGALYNLGSIDRSVHRPGPGRDPAAIDPDAIERTAVYATIGDDGAQGVIRLHEEDGAWLADDGVAIAWPDVGKRPVFTEAMRILQDAHRRDGAILIPNPMWRLLPSAMGQILDGGEIGGAVLTVHPLGGCAMAEHADEGVVNHLGQVFAAEHGDKVHSGLVVLDGAIVPTALGINPCLTIAALSEHAVEGLAAAWGLRPADDFPAAIAALPALPKPHRLRPRAPEPRPTAVRLAERLTGKLKLGGEASVNAELELEYEPIPDLETFLAGTSRILEVGNGRLKLTRALPDGGGEEEVTLEVGGEVSLLEREATTFWRRVRAAGCAWYANRGKRELFAAIKGTPRRLLNALLHGPKPGPGLWTLVLGWIVIASHAGERRVFQYRLEVAEGAGAVGLLMPGDCLHGTKTIAYIAGGRDGEWSSLWDQLTKLPLSLRRKGRAELEPLGWLEVDLPYFVQQHATQLQVDSQENQPRAIADLFSLFAYLLRVVGKIHIWSLRAPDYPDPYPIYEFTPAEKAEAEEAAKGVAAKTEDRRLHRLPQDLPGFDRKVLPLDPADRPQDPRSSCLTHYTPCSGAPKHGPVLLIHGLGASGNTFTLPTVDENLVQHLARKGFDPWVLDLRTSIGLLSSKREWKFEDVAFGDIPEALRVVCRETGGQPVNVVAHCIGAAMFSMAALEGKLDPGAVRAAVLSQVGPLIEFPPTNRFRGFLASYLKHYLDVDELDTASPPTPFTRFLDRLLATLPYPFEEWKAHHQGVKPVRHEAYCLRSYGIYGRLFEHGNLNEETLNRLGDYLGHIRYATYQQTIFYATMRRLTDWQGANAFVTHERIRQHLNFPICLLHGRRNEVFHPRTSQRSFDLLASIFWPDDLDKLWKAQPGRRKGYSLYRNGKRLRIVEIPRFGHQDCMIGERASVKVYYKISGFLSKCDTADVKPAEALVVVRPPRLGPVLGWVRKAGEGYVARVLFAPNDSRSRPSHAISIVLKDGEPVRERAKFIRLRPESAPKTEALDVDLPDGDPADYRVVVVTAHEESYEAEPEREAGEPRGDDPFGEDLDRFPSPPITLPPGDGNADPVAKSVLRTCKDLDLRCEPIPTGRRVSHRRYAAPVSAALVSREVLEAARPTPPEKASICFALASCRYTSTIADREAADAGFGRLRDRLESPHGPKPQLLFLAGDAIYADASYGIFDPTAPRDRYDQRYVEAWTAPNAREVLRRVPVYPMLDDHEVEENFEGRRPEHKAGLDAFEAFQLRLTRAFSDARQPEPDRPGYWYIARAGGFEFFVADSRTGRRRDRGRASANAEIMHRDQMLALQSWLRDVQLNYPDMPKFIVSPSVVAPWSRETRGHPGYALRSDAWDGFPASLHELLGFIARERIRNVVFLSGDYHCSVFCTMRLALEGQPVVNAYSIVSSGLYTPYPFANSRFEDLAPAFAGPYKRWLGDESAVAPGELMIAYRATEIPGGDGFALVNVPGPAGSRQMTVEYVTDRGSETRQVQLST